VSKVSQLPVESYVIRFPNGKVYCSGPKGSFMGNDLKEAKLFTETAAKKRIAMLGRMSMMWRDARVLPLSAFKKEP
jgi:hypothetical protein